MAQAAAIEVSVKRCRNVAHQEAGIISHSQTGAVQGSDACRNQIPEHAERQDEEQEKQQRGWGNCPGDRRDLSALRGQLGYSAAVPGSRRCALCAISSLPSGPITTP